MSVPPNPWEPEPEPEPAPVGEAENCPWPQDQYSLPMPRASTTYGSGCLPPIMYNSVLVDGDYSSKHQGRGTHADFQPVSRDTTFAGLASHNAPLLESLVSSGAFPSYDQTALQGLGDTDLVYGSHDIIAHQQGPLSYAGDINPFSRNVFWTAPNPVGSASDIALRDMALAPPTINSPQERNPPYRAERQGFDSTLNSSPRNGIPALDSHLNLHLQTQVDSSKRRTRKNNNSSEFVHCSLMPPNTCSECHAYFSTSSALNNHAKATHHAAHKCTCQVTFSRLDCLNRHIHDFSTARRGGAFPCRYCTKYVGDKAFLRKYHLAQHLRGYHKIEIEVLGT